jgi:D-glycero-D-manno-heptose 1,7-bisphosphate phosphatase
VSRPEDVRLIPGAAEAISRLNASGVPVIVVSNQSGIGRGYFTFDDYALVQARVEELLSKRGAHLDGIYICPHAPSDESPCACRKPGVALFECAAHDHAVDLRHSWYAGDKWRDVEPARVLGGHGFLIPARSTPASDVERAREFGVVRDSLGDVVREIIAALTGEQGAR